VGQAEQDSNERGLSGAVGTEVAERASSRNEQLDIVDRYVVAEALGETVRLHGPGALPSVLTGAVLEYSCNHFNCSLDRRLPYLRKEYAKTPRATIRVNPDTLMMVQCEERNRAFARVAAAVHGLKKALCPNYAHCGVMRNFSPVAWRA
jgi:hypothetical protein